MSDRITVGFLPLMDSMLLAVAREMGFAKAQGIELELVRETSWASIRDRLAVGHFDAAHMLAPMPIAFNIGLMPLCVPVIAPMALGLGGNAVTVSNSLWMELERNGARPDCNPLGNGNALRRTVEERATKGKPKLRFGVVHPFSGHNLELRYWLSAVGVDPQNHVEIAIVPPPLMPDALASGQLDGYCVGEPWNSVAVANGTGIIVTTKSHIWRSSPEKVLAVRQDWAQSQPELLNALIRALYYGAQWCSKPSNHGELADLLGSSDYVNVPAGTLMPAISGRLSTGIDGAMVEGDVFTPFERAATFPWQSHALWFYTQMVRWGQIEHSADAMNLARESYRPDLYRRALLDSGAAIPTANLKVEGALKEATAAGSTGRLMLGPDGFFDDRIFDPAELERYLFDLQS